jgi:drug/metabolite transporter (DMT)-like permease
MGEQRVDKYAPEWQIWLGLAIIYIVWGTTYLAIRVVVDTMPPLLSGGARFVIAGAIIFAILVVRRGFGALRLERSEWIGAAVIGAALLLGGNGLVMLGERDVPSALAALIVAVVPLWVVILRRVFGERIARGTVIGVVVGFLGAAILIVPEGISGQVAIGGIVMLLLADVSWSLGTFYSKRLDLPRDPLASTGAQMLLGGALMLVVGVLFGELGLVRLERFSTPSVISFLYLIVLGSVLAYTAYTWLLQHAPVSRVATYAYVNPVVAIVLGVALLDERMTPTMLFGAALIVLSVAVVIRSEQRTGAHPTGAAEASPLASEEGIELEEKQARVSRPR